MITLKIDSGLMQKVIYEIFSQLRKLPEIYAEQNDENQSSLTAFRQIKPHIQITELRLTIERSRIISAFIRSMTVNCAW